LIPPNFPDKNYNPGPEALKFFTDFANSAKEVYTWNKTFPNSLEAFAAGKVAMIFGYNYDIPYLEAKRQGKLNYAVAKMPQIDGRSETNFANYWIQVVSKKSKNINEAWDFLQFISKKSEVKKYLDKTGRVTALRSLIDEEVANDKLNIFANQLLTAKSWYRGFNPQAAENALKELIENTREGADFNQALNIAVQKIQQTMQ
jgi:ABC-type glycerol-3-phosphate transport system substrate-binding protein